MNGKGIKQEIEERNEEALFIDGLDGDKEGFNDALIGWGERCALDPVAMYDVNKIISILETKYGMSYREANEWYDYNIIGAYMGEATPIYVCDLRNA
jgi:hypothetical protein